MDIKFFFFSKPWSTSLLQYVQRGSKFGATAVKSELAQLVSTFVVALTVCVAVLLLLLLAVVVAVVVDALAAAVVVIAVDAGVVVHNCC